MGAVPAPAAKADSAVSGLQVYVVGGAVRDALLGLPAGDCDWVVVGATPEQMAARGFLPVGGDFPVFLHPVTKEEYALARTERKSGRGYKGFTLHCGTEVSLQEDLQRRDLTINAIARAADGGLVDPYDGQGDIRRRLLRHVGPAFSEDPVRLLRLARFAARFTDFDVAPETLALANSMVENGEVDALVPERVWRELEKSLRSARPDRFLQVLSQVGALPRVLPGLAIDDAVVQGLLRGVAAGLPVPGLFALLCRRSADPAAIAAHVRAPADHRDQAVLLPIVLDHLTAMQDADDPVAAWLDLIERCDALRKPDRFLQLVAAAACVVPDPDLLPSWRQRVQAVRAIDAGAVARSVSGPDAIRQALRQARLAALAGVSAAVSSGSAGPDAV